MLRMALVCIAALMTMGSFWGTAQAKIYGFYSGGCFDRWQQMAPDGLGYQGVRLGRQRLFAHDEMARVLTSLSDLVSQTPKKVLLFGDISQQWGGPMKDAHASHQVGLDADVWFWHPVEAETRSLSLEERESLSAVSMVKSDYRTMDYDVWRPYHAEILKLASEQVEVQRIFVNPVIKKELCNTAGKDRAWLRKIRPWYGHNYHFHIRLRCPEGENQCERQADPPAGDGCTEVDDWLKEVQTFQFVDPFYEVPFDLADTRAKKWPRECDRLVRK